MSGSTLIPSTQAIVNNAKAQVDGFITQFRSLLPQQYQLNDQLSFFQYALTNANNQFSTLAKQIGGKVCSTASSPIPPLGTVFKYTTSGLCLFVMDKSDSDPIYAKGLTGPAASFPITRPVVPAKADAFTASMWTYFQGAWDILNPYVAQVNTIKAKVDQTTKSLNDINAQLTALKATIDSFSSNISSYSQYLSDVPLTFDAIQTQVANELTAPTDTAESNAVSSPVSALPQVSTAQILPVDLTSQPDNLDSTPAQAAISQAASLLNVPTVPAQADASQMTVATQVPAQASSLLPLAAVAALLFMVKKR